MRKNNRGARAGHIIVQFFVVVCEMTAWNFEIKVLTTTWTHNSKSFILYIYFNAARTSPFAAALSTKEDAMKKQ